MICGRCGKESRVSIMSMFNSVEICMDCKEKEQQHPKYPDAVAADMEAIRRGNYNFRGIGAPEDL